MVLQTWEPTDKPCTCGFRHGAEKGGGAWAALRPTGLVALVAVVAVLGGM